MSEPVDMDDLNAFENTFFGKKAAAPAKEAPVIEDEEDVIENRDDAPATEDEDEPEDESGDEGDEPEDEDEDEDDEEDEPAPKPKGKKNFQTRINELTAAKREAERREAELLRRLEALEAQKEVKQEKPALRDVLPTDAPDPDASDDDGEPIYPLGEFDPKYIRDLTKFTIAAETKAAREAEQQKAEQAAVQAALAEVNDKWMERLDQFEEEVPSIRDDIADMADVFQDIPEAYGEYLATTIMSSDVGPQIMHYFSQNIGEAQKIVAAGPAAATLAIGRLEAKFLKDEPVGEPKRNKVVSKAPEPPKTRSRGSGGSFSVAPDTNDLDAFEREFFKKR